MNSSWCDGRETIAVGEYERTVHAIGFEPIKALGDILPLDRSSRSPCRSRRNPDPQSKSEGEVRALRQQPASRLDRVGRSVREQWVHNVCKAAVDLFDGTANFMEEREAQFGYCYSLIKPSNSSSVHT
jgi:hypothetical protein